MKSILASLIVLFFCQNEKIKSDEVKINWVQKLKGDFTFTKKWEYPEGIFRNQYNQLDCNGFCPEGIDSMKDEKSRILKKYCKDFYKLVDTTHQHFSLKGKSWCYEYAGSHFAKAIKQDDGSILCYTLTNASTHCSLNIIIQDNICQPTIVLNSISSQNGSKVYSIKYGRITIDQSKWEKGKFKSSFNFEFNHPENLKQKMFC